jgi:gliding motility-associated lipoprotein GldH
MKKIILALSIVSLIAGISCSTREPVFEKYHKFENSSWDRFNKIVFNIPIVKPDVDYTITLVLKPNKSFIYNSMPVYVIMNTPAGEERMNEVKIAVKDGGKFIGEVEGQPLVIKTVLWQSLHISDKGTCRISIENMVPKILTEGISEIGIIVEQIDSK